MNLQQLRDYVRAQLDVDEEELPNQILDVYIREGFDRTLSQENRWPFFESKWSISKVPDVDEVALPADCDPAGILVVASSENNLRLVQIANELAFDKFGGQAPAGAQPSYYSVHSQHLHLWPSPDTTATIDYILWGHRYPADWITEGGAGGVPDCDVRLHQLLAYYAIALAYAQQEDEVLEDTYMRRWQASYLAAHNAICNVRHHRPLVLNAGIPVMPAYNPVVWASPPVGP